MTLFEMIADERRGIADLVDTLNEQQLCTPSLVPTWTVRDVAAHLVMGFGTSLPRFMGTLLIAGSFDKAADKLTFRMAKRPVNELTDLLRRHAENRFTPPGAGPEAPLTDLLVHGLDFRRPLGIHREIPQDRSRPALDFLAKTPARGFVRKGWRDGLRFEATDFEWSHGEGALVRGGSDALMLAITGRTAALEELEGPGVSILRRRFLPG
jgi:uncharacterized protein (TIGR03083 family)